MRRSARVLLTLALVSGASSCMARNTSGTESGDLAEGNRAFALDLYSVLSAGEGNIFFSPYSISAALAMTCAGAGGATEEEMRAVLHFNLPGEELHRAFCSLQGRLESGTGEDEGFVLHTVNALWGQSGHEFLPDFLALLSDYYGAGIRILDFSDDPESCRNAINGWVSERTEERISRLIPPGVLTTSTKLVLTNAIYFNAQWLLLFDETATARRPFTLLTGERVEVPSMSVTEHFMTARGNGYMAVELPYSGRDMFMLVILPDSGRFSDVEEMLGEGHIDQAMEGMRDASLHLRLPRFRSTSRFMLEDALSSMGMTSAFGPGADFSGMDGTRWLYISSIVHSAFVSVNEYGTEAAAATAVVMGKMNGESSSLFDVNRPFIYLIIDRSTRTVLFMGRMLDPRSSEA